MSPVSSQEASQLRNGDVEPAVAVEPVPGRASTATAPLAHGALRRTDESAELLEQEDAVVVPLIGNADRGDGHGPTPFVNRPQVAVFLEKQPRTWNFGHLPSDVLDHLSQPAVPAIARTRIL